MSIGRAKKHYHGNGLTWKVILKASAFVIFMSLCLISINKVKTIEYFPIHNVKVFGAQHVEHTDVQKLISPFVNSGFFCS